MSREIPLAERRRAVKRKVRRETIQEHGRGKKRAKWVSTLRKK